MKLFLKMRLRSVLWQVLVLIFASVSIMAQTAQVFRLDGVNSTYAFGVNERGELQTLYWGGRIGPHDSIPPAHSLPGWGAGLFTEPALKVSFADGNRDLVLHFVKATPNDSHTVDVLLKDISREI